MKKYKSFAQFFSASVVGVAIALTFSLTSQAQSTGIEFFCGTNQDVPATMARTPERDKPVIQWTRPLGNYSAQERCEVVSNRFQTYIVQQGMEHITIGNENGLPVVCASATANEEGGCQASLFTLSSWEDAEQIRKQLEQLRWYVQGPIRQGGQEYIYFDLAAYLRSNADQEYDVFPLLVK